MHERRTWFGVPQYRLEDSPPADAVIRIRHVERNHPRAIPVAPRNRLGRSPRTIRLELHLASMGKERLNLFLKEFGRRTLCRVGKCLTDTKWPETVLALSDGCEPAKTQEISILRAAHQRAVDRSSQGRQDDRLGLIIQVQQLANMANPHTSRARGRTLVRLGYALLNGTLPASGVGAAERSTDARHAPVDIDR